MKKCGGLSEAQEANDEIQGLCDQVKPLVREKLGNTLSEFVVMSYRTQTVAGTNYFVKIKVDGEKYIHARIFKPLPHTNSGPELNSIQKDKTSEDAIEYF